MQTKSGLFTRIQRALPEMSDAKRSVGIYLLESWQEAVFLSASRLAKVIGLSESVVVRFAQDIEYSGYPELQQELQEILKNRLTAIPKIEGGGDFLSGKSADAINNVYKLTLQNLKNTTVSNDNDQIHKAVELIKNARRILIVASRNALGPAKILGVHLNEIFTNTHVITANHDEIFDYIRALTNADLLISFGLPGYSRSTITAVEYARNLDIPQVTFTDSSKSPLIFPETIVLITHYKSYSYASSHVSTVFLIDVIINLITTQDDGRVLKGLEELAEISRNYKYYQNY